MEIMSGTLLFEFFERKLNNRFDIISRTKKINLLGKDVDKGPFYSLLVDFHLVSVANQSMHGRRCYLEKKYVILFVISMKKKYNNNSLLFKGYL